MKVEFGVFYFVSRLINNLKLYIHMINILLWIVFGGIAGWLAAEIVGTEMVWYLDVLTGIVGAFIGGFIADKVNFKEGQPGADRPTSFWSFVWAVVGAVVLLLLISLL